MVLLSLPSLASSTSYLLYVIWRARSPRFVGLQVQFGIELNINIRVRPVGIAEHVRKGGKPLEWDMRLSIAIGSARGLCHLHHDCIPHIIHRDIKTSNILLDADMEAHVSDFGLAKLISPQQTHVTTMVAGTLGYLPPGESCSC